MIQQDNRHGPRQGKFLAHLIVALLVLQFGALLFAVDATPIALNEKEQQKSGLPLQPQQKQQKQLQRQSIGGAGDGEDNGLRKAIENEYVEVDNGDDDNDIDAHELRQLYANKRSRGFLPSRGKKETETFDDGSEFDTNRLGFMAELEKRRQTSFMPMRGRKWSSPDSSGPSAQRGAGLIKSQEAPLAQAWYNAWMINGGGGGRGGGGGGGGGGAPNYQSRYYSIAPSNFNQYMRNGAESNYPAASYQSPAVNTFDNLEPTVDLQSPPAMLIDKRKGMGFFGARGKRSIQ